MKRLSSGLGALGLFFLTVSIASAQPPGRGRGGAPPAPSSPQNLQVLPRDIALQDLLVLMQASALALGVTCDYCHVGVFGTSDFKPALDDKPTKKTARVMLRMMQNVNATLGSELGKPVADVTGVQCVTCHRGVPIPKQLVDILTETGAQRGVPAALQQYRDLRKRFYGGQSYDFTESSLITAAQRAVQANKLDDAIAYLQANLEFFPKSVQSYVTMSQAYTRKNDKDNAIKSLEKAVELDPDDQQMKRRLQQLKG